MSLRSYHKNSQIKAGDRNYYSAHYDPETISFRPEHAVPGQRYTMWDLVGGSYNGLKKLVSSSNATGLIIPFIFILMGVSFIYANLRPQIADELRGYVGYLNQGNVAPVAGDYIETRLQYVSNPGTDYFAKLIDSATNAGFIEDRESLTHNGIFYISIPRLGISRLPVKSNVNSVDADVYKLALNTTLAHFRGTSLPHVSNPGNIVVYGHSVGGSYNPNPRDVVSAFTFLGNMQVGDEIVIEMEGKTYKYRTRSTRIVEPADTSILLGTPGREMLTLFTCWKPGSNENRLVVQAVPVN